LARREGADLVPVGPPTHLYRHYGLDEEGIARAVRRMAGLAPSP